MLKRFRSKDDFLLRLVTVDDHYYEPENKAQNGQWVGPGSPTPKKFKTQPSAGKLTATVFWDSKGVIIFDVLPKTSTITGLYSANCAPLVADLFLFCYERDFMLSLSEDNQSDVIEVFISTSRYLDDLLNIDNNCIDSMVNHIYLSDLQLNKANVSDTKASFLDLLLSISDGFVKTKIYNKRDDFDFDIVNVPFFRWRCSSFDIL